jgi:hypothetical protein
MFNVLPNDHFKPFEHYTLVRYIHLIGRLSCLNERLARSKQLKDT